MYSKLKKHDFSYLLHSHFENAKEALATLATNIPVHYFATHC